MTCVIRPPAAADYISARTSCRAGASSQHLPIQPPHPAPHRLPLPQQLRPQSVVCIIANTVASATRMLRVAYATASACCSRWIQVAVVVNEDCKRREEQRCHHPLGLPTLPACRPPTIRATSFALHRSHPSRSSYRTTRCTFNSPDNTSPLFFDRPSLYSTAYFLRAVAAVGEPIVVRCGRSR